MGVPGLWKELQCHGNDTCLTKLSHLAGRNGSSTSSQTKLLKLGIDVSSWLFHAQKCVGGYNPQLRLLFYRLCKLLAIPDVLPVFVFDGPLRPKEKRGKVTKTYREAAFVSELKNLIIAFGFVVHDAIGEAEAEMAQMNRRGIFDAVMSDDVDCFVFGATLVIRNWGQELSGSKARTTYNADASADSSPCPSSNEDCLAPSASQGDQPLSAKDRLALGNNLITYYRASNLEQDGLTTNGLILVAILSGGDYDVQGLPRCGVKIAMALAKAGFGDSLIEGLKTHCSPPKKSSASSLSPNRQLASPQPLTTWSSFLIDWLASVRHELSTDESGHLGKRFKKLAQSLGFAELLSTKASLSVLGSYVWPLIKEETLHFQLGKLDVGQISTMCQKLFHWTAGNTLETFRNNLWQGCVIRELTGGEIGFLNKSTLPPREDIPQIKSGTANIASYFTVKIKSTTANEEQPSSAASLVLLIAGERENASTDHVRELRVICDVKDYAKLATKGLDFDLCFHQEKEGDALPSSQGTPAASPRERKPFEDPNKEVRMWIAQEVVVRNHLAAKQVEKYHLKKKSKVDLANSKVKSTIDQERIDSFFIGKKKLAAPIAVGKSISLSKRRAPLRTSSLSSLSSAPSRSSSPCLDKAKDVRLKGQASQASTNKQSPPIAVRKEKNRTFEYAKWDSNILTHSDDEGTKDKEAYDFDASSSLPSLSTLLASRKNIRTVANTIGSNSVEIIKVTHSPTKKRNKITSATAIEVFDDSDEE